MSDERIAPALSREEWQRVKAHGGPDRYEGFLVDTIGTDRGYFIALANAALPDGDPRKITRDHVTLLRDAAEDIPSNAAGDMLLRLADALESYLPPEDVR